MNALMKHIIKLRGHHLVCLHLFKGEGYNHEYVENLRDILQRAEAGEEIKVSSGADDVCRMCPNLQGEMCDYSENAESGIREMDMAALALLRLRSGEEVLWFDLQKELPQIFPEWAGRYCNCCGWRSVCEKQETFYRLTRR